MTIDKRARMTITALASSLVLGLAACGDEDVERNIEEGAQEVKDAGRDAEKAGEDAAKEAEKAGEDVKKAGEDAANEVEKQAKEAERELSGE
jgi:F0F1-type ATP synthase membrane subunit b/b'